MMASRKSAGFTLLEVMLSVAIMAIALSAVFSAEAGSVKMAVRARKMGFASLLSRCKMGEIEEDLAKRGLPSIYQSESDQCCKDAPIDGFSCRWEVVPIVLPETMFGGEDEDGDGKKSKKGGAQGNDSASSASGAKDGKSGGLTGLLGAAAAALGGKKDGSDADSKSKDDKSKDEKDKDGKPIDKKDPNNLLQGDPSQFLAGSQEGGGQGVDSMTAMAMQFVYPVLKPSFQAQIRRVSVTVKWAEGSADKKFELTQYVVAEQAVPLATDPNNPNALLGTGATGTGTTTGTGSTSTLGTTGLGR